MTAPIGKPLPSRGYHHSGKPMPSRRFNFSPKIDPPAIVPCPTCLASVIATRGKYWDADPIGEGLFNFTEHPHQRSKAGYKDEHFNARPAKEQPED